MHPLIFKNKHQAQGLYDSKDQADLGVPTTQETTQENSPANIGEGIGEGLTANQQRIMVLLAQNSRLPAKEFALQVGIGWRARHGMDEVHVSINKREDKDRLLRYCQELAGTLAFVRSPTETGNTINDLLDEKVFIELAGLGNRERNELAKKQRNYVTAKLSSTTTAPHIP